MRGDRANDHAGSHFKVETVTITPCCKSYREAKKLAKHMIKEEKTRKWL